MRLELRGQAAVTAVGMTAAQTCAAIRAGIKRFTPIEAAVLDDEEPQIGARVSADPRLRANEADWLRNLAARALLEAELDPHTPLLWQIPEPHRGHALSACDDADALAGLSALLGHPLSEHSRVLRSGAAGLIEGLGTAHELIAAGKVERCVIGGADSLLREPDLDRLARDRRLLADGNAQGLVPGEGAAFVVVGRGNQAGERADEAGRRPTILGLGLGYEHASVLAGRRSVGEAFASAFESAIQLAGIPESEIDFVAGNHNGERYDAWETSHQNARSYRTRRERLPVLWPAASTGELGVAGGAMALIAAALAIEQDYAAGPTAAIQLRSEAELRGVALLRATREGSRAVR